MNSNVILALPPLWDIYSPPASLPALVGYLQANGVAASQVDLNQAYFQARCDQVLQDAVGDLLDKDTWENRLPYEHKVVLGATVYSPDLLSRHGIDSGELTFHGCREALKTWDTNQLNVLDALLHYGYFIRSFRAMVPVEESERAMDDPIWQPLREQLRRTLRAKIEREQPEIVGLSILGSQQLPAAIACTKWLRSFYSGTVIWGGSEIRYTFEKMQAPTAWWRDLPDYLCLGEGETALLKLTRRHLNGSTVEATQPRRPRKQGPPLVILGQQSADAGTNAENDIRGLLKAPFLNAQLPKKYFESVAELASYSFDGLDLSGGYLMESPPVPYQASRGCHWGICAFCDHEEGYRLHYRPKSPQQVVDDLETFREYGLTHFQFVDEAIEPEWFAAFLTELESRGLTDTFRWSNYSKIAKSLTPELLDRSYASGCRMLLFGVETFNQRILKHIRKGVTREQIFRVVRDTHAAGLRCWIWLISGLPTQTPKELERDVADLESLLPDLHSVSVGRYRISANSDLGRNPSKFGVLAYDLDAPMDVTCEHDGRVIGPEELARIYYESYYPMAVERSLSHNRYIVFSNALREEQQDYPRRAALRPPRPRHTPARTKTLSELAAEFTGPGDL